MATRVWFPADTASPITPTIQGSWTSSGQKVDRKLANTKGTTAIAIGSTIDVTSGANNHSLDRIYVSTTLDGAQTISGTVTGQLMVREFATTDNVNRWYVGIFVVSGDGATLRGTLLSVGTYRADLEHINNATCRNFTLMDGDALTSVNALNGDRIQIEMGPGMSSTGTSPQGAAKYGENATDLPVNDTQTTDGAGWVEFSGTVTFFVPPLALGAGLILE